MDVKLQVPVTHTKQIASSKRAQQIKSIYGMFLHFENVFRQLFV